MQFVQILMISSSSSFSECFSAFSYIQGNSITYELVLHLVPFERLNQITDQNLCQIYLPGKTVIAKLHFDDISFPEVGSEISFTYEFNVPITVKFSLSETDYSHIYSKQNAMYELWYDVNLVNINGSVNTIEHTKFNGTGCYSYIELVYDIHGDIQISVEPNDCQIQLDSSSEVYLEYFNGKHNEQIRITPCTINCDADEYKETSDFKQNMKYFIKKSSTNEEQLDFFYKSFVNNRRIPMYFCIKYNINGVFMTITELIYYAFAADPFECTTDELFFLASTLNPLYLFIQYRYSQPNKLNCHMAGVTKVVIDVNVYDNTRSFRGVKQFSLENFNQDVGVIFEHNDVLDDLRDNYNFEESKSIVAVSFLNDQNEIVWESIRMDMAYIGCVTKAVLHLYDNQTCLRYQLDSNTICTGQFLKPTSTNTLGIFYKESSQIHSLGYYEFHYAINYTQLDQSVCFVCDEFVESDSYAMPTCHENQKLTKEKLKTAQIGFGIISKYESIILTTVVSEYYGVFMPLAAVSAVVLIGTMIAIACFIRSFTK
ncbi:Conserved_hypothetical protein [Hexamita inflata]|uniref:Uncharacterized protein n=1 Tax=Hexamita inflata TaxID=28002 RepID=A0AA86QAX2_9EUKA|nr:Conserved hypothetical protein [Hexamita inflata]